MDSAEAQSAVNFTVTEFEKIMAALTSFGSTLDTHGQALTNQREALTSHAQLLQQYGQSIQQLATQTPRAPDPQPATLLTDKVRAWATAIWQRQGPECSDFKIFSEDIRIRSQKSLFAMTCKHVKELMFQLYPPNMPPNMLRVFDQSVSSAESAKKLMSIRQGKGSVADYGIAFRTLAAVNGWNDAALVVAFHHGLSDTIKDGLASAGCPSDLEPLISHAMRLDNHLRERRRDQGPSQSYPVTPGQFWSPVPPPLENPEPMQIGCTDITAAERERRRRERGAVSTVESPVTFALLALSFWEKTRPVQPREGFDGRHSFSRVSWSGGLPAHFHLMGGVFSLLPGPGRIWGCWELHRH